MRVSWLHLRNCPVRWALPILAAFDLAVLFLRNRYWIGSWPDTGAAAQVPTYILGPLVAGTAAWSAAAVQRYGLTEQLGAVRVHRAMAEAYRFGATLVVLTAAYLVGQAVAFAFTIRTTPPGLGIWSGYLVHGLFVTFLNVAVGWAIGMLARSSFAPLMAAFASLLLVGVVGRWVELSVIGGPPDVQVDPLGVSLRLGVLLALLVALLWVPVFDGFRRRVSVATAIGFGVVVLVVAATPLRVDRPEPGDKVLCVDGRAKLCIWPEHQKYLPMLSQINARVDALPTAFRLPPRMIEFAIERNWHIEDGPHGPIMHEDSVGTPSFNILEGSIWSSAGDVATGIMGTTFEFTNGESCRWATQTSTDSARLWAVGAWLESYLVGGGSPDYHTNAPPEMRDAFNIGREMARRPLLAEQFSWAEREVKDLHGRYCRS